MNYRIMDQGVDVGSGGGLPGHEQLCSMVLRLDWPYQAMAWVMMETGWRFGETATLRVSDFRAHERRLTSSVGLSVTVSAGLAEVLSGHAARLRSRFDASGARFHRGRDSRSGLLRFADQFLFPSIPPDQRDPVRSEPCSMTVFVRALQESARAAGFAGLVHSNTLRLACARRWLEQGVPVTELHRRLGHGDMMTTLLMVQALEFGGLTFTADAGGATGDAWAVRPFATPSPSLPAGRGKAA